MATNTATTTASTKHRASKSDDDGVVDRADAANDDGDAQHDDDDAERDDDNDRGHDADANADGYARDAHGDDHGP